MYSSFGKHVVGGLRLFIASVAAITFGAGVIVGAIGHAFLT